MHEHVDWNFVLYLSHKIGFHQNGVGGQKHVSEALFFSSVKWFTIVFVCCAERIAFRGEGEPIFPIQLTIIAEGLRKLWQKSQGQKMISGENVGSSGAESRAKILIHGRENTYFFVIKSLNKSSIYQSPDLYFIINSKFQSLWQRNWSFESSEEKRNKKTASSQGLGLRRMVKRKWALLSKWMWRYDRE